LNQITKHIDTKADIHIGFQKYGYHILFWLAFYLFFVLNDNKTEFGLLFTLVKELINVLFYVAIVYINLYYLIKAKIVLGLFIIDADCRFDDHTDKNAGIFPNLFELSRFTSLLSRKAKGYILFLVPCDYRIHWV